jgi:hypothetical protein
MNRSHGKPNGQYRPGLFEHFQHVNHYVFEVATEVGDREG